jgi:lysylphosphatidylglycerol synthetase-like protein (DUF2156 family)
MLAAMRVKSPFSQRAWFGFIGFSPSARRQAFSATFQAGLKHFGDERGFLAYKKVGHTTFVLSDPVAPSENIPDLIARFLREHRDAAFCCLSAPVANILAARRFFVNAMGPDTWIELPSYTFKGSKKKLLREPSIAW